MISELFSSLSFVVQIALFEILCPLRIDEKAPRSSPADTSTLRELPRICVQTVILHSSLVSDANIKRIVVRGPFLDRHVLAWVELWLLKQQEAKGTAIGREEETGPITRQCASWRRENSRLGEAQVKRRPQKKKCWRTRGSTFATTRQGRTSPTIAV